ncbi:MAG: M2 family metallopeptidase, partial [Thermoanaerobaculia bacterium]
MKSTPSRRALVRARAIVPLALLLFARVALGADAKPATPAEAEAFLEEAETRLLKLSIDSDRASWVQANFITDDTEILSAQASERRINAAVELAKRATRFDGLKLPEAQARKLKLLKLSLTVAAPSNPAESAELTRILAGMEGTYGKGKYCRADGKCLDLEEITRIMATSRDPKELLDVWNGWHAIAPPMRAPYMRYVELANKGARELGFPDTGAMWRSKYDMPPDEFARELD